MLKQIFFTAEIKDIGAVYMTVGDFIHRHGLFVKAVSFKQFIKI